MPSKDDVNDNENGNENVNDSDNDNINENDSDNDNDSEKDNDNINKNGNMKKIYIKDWLDEKIDKTKPFEDQIKSLKKVKI